MPTRQTLLELLKIFYQYTSRLSDGDVACGFQNLNLEKCEASILTAPIISFGCIFVSTSLKAGVWSKLGGVRGLLEEYIKTHEIAEC